MRIGLVCPYDLTARGGVQAQVMGLAARFEHLGHRVDVVGPGTEGLSRVRRFRLNRSVAPVALGRGSARTARRRLAGCDVVHVHEPFVPAISWGALGCGSPLVATFHAAVPPAVAALYRSLAPIGRRRLGGAVLTAVSATAARGPRLLGLEATIIPNGVVVPPEVSGQAARSGVVFVGRDEPRKGLGVLLAAWERVQPAVPEATLTVVGAVRNPIPGVRFLTGVDDEEKARILGDSAILCAPNLGGESFGIIVAEGMAAGCAVVCSDLPAFVDVGGEGVALTPVGDAEALARALITLLGDKQGRVDLARRGRAHAARYSLDDVASAYLETYRRATGD